MDSDPVSDERRFCPIRQVQIPGETNLSALLYNSMRMAATFFLDRMTPSSAALLRCDSSPPRYSRVFPLDRSLTDIIRGRSGGTNLPSKILGGLRFIVTASPRSGRVWALAHPARPVPSRKFTGSDRSAGSPWIDRSSPKLIESRAPLYFSALGVCPDKFAETESAGTTLTSSGPVASRWTSRCGNAMVIPALRNSRSMARFSLCSIGYQ